MRELTGGDDVENVRRFSRRMAESRASRLTDIADLMQPLTRAIEAVAQKLLGQLGSQAEAVGGIFDVGDGEVDGADLALLLGSWS